MPPLFCSCSFKDLIRRKICKSDCRPNKLFFHYCSCYFQKRNDIAQFPFSLLLCEINRLSITTRKGKFAKASSPNKPFFSYCSCYSQSIIESFKIVDQKLIFFYLKLSLIKIIIFLCFFLPVFFFRDLI